MPQTYQIDVQLEVNEPVPVALLERAAAWVLSDHKQASGTGLSIAVLDDVAVQALNQQFRGVDAPTDVLSFEAELPDLPPDIAAEASADVDSTHYLGDLALALPTIQRQAAQQGHDAADELTLAVVHGTLHLLGFDHDNAANQAVMWAHQSRALAALGVNIQVPLFEFDDPPADE